MCSWTVLNELKNLHTKKVSVRSDFVGALYNASAIFFVVAMLVLLNENRRCR